jgi:hypothetical protein
MTTSDTFEVFSPAMKARLDLKYRRRMQERRPLDNAAFWREVELSEQKTALPFTTKTRAYGTYNWKKR